MTGWVKYASVVAAAVLAASAARSRRSAEAGTTASLISSAPQAPLNCQTVPAGTSLQTTLDAAAVGASLCLNPGSYAGPIVVHHPITLWGPRSAVIRSAGSGSTMDVQSNQVQLLGFTVHGSGDRFDRNDSAVRIHGAQVRVEGVRIENALFGLTAEESRDVSFIGNEITGDARQPTGLRGDAIRIWETPDSVVEGNTVSFVRDILIWYSPRSRVSNNTVSHSRYGTHFMYSREAVVAGNRYLGNLVGVFAMYSHGVTLENNLVLDSSGSDGMGFGVKDSDHLLFRQNRVIRDTTGIYVDASPASADNQNRFEQNLFALNGVAIVFHASEVNTTVTGNSFRNNQALVAVEGSGDGLGITWHENYFDDYQGYDLDHDGRGDVPYELRSLSGDLTRQHPELGFLAGSPALGFVDVLSHVFPLFEPKLILVDNSPRMTPATVWEGSRAD